MSTGPTLFPIISTVKLATKRVFLEFSTLVRRYWRLSTESLGIYTKDAVEKHNLTFKLRSFYSFWL